MYARQCIFNILLACLIGCDPPGGSEGHAYAPQGKGGPTGSSEGPESGSSSGGGTNGASGATDAGGGSSGGALAACVSDADCGSSADECHLLRCEAQRCNARAVPDGKECALGADPGRCALGACTGACGDGLLQPSRGESCDDGNLFAGDGCRADCVREELIGLGYTGGQCASDDDCAPAGSQCLTAVYGGSCIVGCSSTCADRAFPTTPITFCIERQIYQERLGAALDFTDPGVCVAKCDFELFPSTGCREGLHCERRPRANQSAHDEVCVPGPWSIGLELSADGTEVLGEKSSGPLPAEPYRAILATECGGSFGPLPASFVRGLADAWLALEDPSLEWQRTCSLPAGLGDRHGTGLEASRAFRLAGTRDEVNVWMAQALYGRAFADRGDEKGPLYRARVAAVKVGTAAYLYSDAAEDHPSTDPARGRHFAVVDGQEWLPLDHELEPDRDYKVIRRSGTQRKGAQWAVPETIIYLAGLARAHLMRHAQPLGVGDLSLPLGGPIAGHSSHQVGLDADIYLLSYPLDGPRVDVDNPELWVASCSSSGGWSCFYTGAFSADHEDMTDAGHVPAAEMLEGLARHAYDFAGVTHFVQHDVEVLAPMRSLPAPRPSYIDASNVSASGWPVHDDHVHLRFSW